MGFRAVGLVATLLALPDAASGFVSPLLSCRRCLVQQDFLSAATVHTTAAVGTAATAAPASSTRLYLRRDDLPEETIRQMEANDKRVKEMEEEYWKSLDAEELAIEKKCALGLACLKLGMLERASEEYIAAAELSKPSSRTWPLGLALFYLGRYEEAAVRLDTDVRAFETQFNESATDERIWQAAAIIRGAREAGADVAQVAATLPPLEIGEPDKLRRTVYELFRGNASPEDVQATVEVPEGGVDYLGSQFFSEMFLGLWHDVHGNEVDAERYILTACLNKYTLPDDLWYHTPRIHAKTRGWT